MIRLILRLAGMTALSVATIMAILDLKRSLAANVPVLTAFADSWKFAFPTVTPAAGDQGPALWQEVVAALMSLPGFAVFAALAVVLLFVGRRAPRIATRLTT